MYDTEGYKEWYNKKWYNREMVKGTNKEIIQPYEALHARRTTRERDEHPSSRTVGRAQTYNEEAVVAIRRTKGRVARSGLGVNDHDVRFLTYTSVVLAESDLAVIK